MDTLIVKNNIIVNDSGATQYIKFRNHIANITYTDIDYNHYYSSAGNSAYWTDSLGVGVVKHWADWRALGYDTHGDTGKVTFTNIWGNKATNYMLSSDSGGIDSGADLSSYFTTDILGIPRQRGAAWDMGAVESK
jgi:hypothetical protein